MNDHHPQKVTLADVKYVEVRTLLNLSFEQLRELENEADIAVCEAGKRLDWIKGAIRVKAERLGLSDAEHY
jgi:hypothetical protein